MTTAMRLPSSRCSNDHTKRAASSRPGQSGPPAGQQLCLPRTPHSTSPLDRAKTTVPGPPTAHQHVLGDVSGADGNVLPVPRRYAGGGAQVPDVLLVKCHPAASIAQGGSKQHCRHQHKQNRGTTTMAGSHVQHAGKGAPVNSSTITQAYARRHPPSPTHLNTWIGSARLMISPVFRSTRSGTVRSSSV